jgi:hypothetical protein
MPSRRNGPASTTAGRRHERRDGQLGILDRLIGALAVLYILPTLIGILRRVGILVAVVILNLFPIAWPAVLVVACMMPGRQDR